MHIRNCATNSNFEELKVRSCRIDGQVARRIVCALAIFCSCDAIAEPDSMLPSDTPSAPTVLAKVAQSIGVHRCHTAVQAVSERMFAQTKHVDVAVDWNKSNPDGAPFFSLSGLEYRDASAALSLTTVPSSAGGCTILVERISSSPTSCSEVARTSLSGYKATTLVRAVTVYSNPMRPRETVTLIDAAPSCVVIRRQVAYDWGSGAQ
jgi:hypothetical protein